VAQSAGIQIGELARQSGCNIETIRYYERIGLLPAPPRSAGRYRLYDAPDVRRLAFVRRARELGFTLDQVRHLLALSAKDGREACCEVHDLAAERRAMPAQCHAARFESRSFFRGGLSRTALSESGSLKRALSSNGGRHFPYHR
jgi:DNA-binding transcriptional MerR regulator